MDTTKAIAFALVIIVACLVLLLPPGSYRSEVPGNLLPARQASTPLTRTHTDSHLEPEQPAAIDLDESLWIAGEKPESSANPSVETQPVDWPLIMYPELARIEALETQPAYTALGELLPMLSDDDPVIRLAAIESLGDMTIHDRLPYLSAALSDPAPQLRIAALEALASQEDESVVSSIEPHLYDQDRDVRMAAIEALVDLESETSVSALAGLLSDQDTLVRHYAVNALGEIGGENAIMYLLQARYDPNATVRASADAILAELEHNEARIAPPTAN